MTVNCSDGGGGAWAGLIWMMASCSWLGGDWQEVYHVHITCPLAEHVPSRKDVKFVHMITY